MHIKNHHISLNIQQHMMLPPMRSNCNQVMRHCIFFNTISLSIRDPINFVVSHHIIFADHYIIFGNSLRTSREIAGKHPCSPISNNHIEPNNMLHIRNGRLVFTHHQLYVSRYGDDMSCCILANLTTRSSRKKKSFERKDFLIR